MKYPHCLLAFALAAFPAPDARAASPLLFNACSADRHSLAFSATYEWPDNPAFEQDFVRIVRELASTLNAHEYGSVHWDQAFAHSWLKPQWRGGLGLGQFYSKRPPVISMRSTGALCADPIHIHQLDP